MNRNLIWSESDCVLQKKDFELIEKDKGVLFPSDFKEKIGPINGSRLRLGYFSHHELGDISYMGNISLSEKSKFNVWEINSWSIKDQNLIPFGDDGNGDYICLNLKDGHIYFWNHETDDVSFICDNFSEFFEMLRCD